MAKVGTLVDGKYEILREIGRGGMSVVYLAMDIRLNKQWAIKEIARKANDANNDIVVASLLAEANLMKKLDHPALPRIVDIIEEHDTIYVVMDYIEGEPLSKILEVYGAQDQDVVIEWGKQLCDVLFYLHNCNPPIIYRDMKPANIMLKPDGTVKLIDFGIAREYKRSKTADTESLGTRGYAAPEQFGGKGQTDARTDIYSFGVTLYHLVTGKNPCEPPYELYPIKQINPNFYDGLQYLIQKCIQLNPNDRFQSCDEIRYVLDNIHEFDKGRRLIQNRKYKAFIASTALAIVFAIMGTGAIGIGRSVLKQSFENNLRIIEQSNDIAQAQEAFSSVINQSGISASDKLRLFAEYYKSIDSLSQEDPNVASELSLRAPDNVVNDILSEFRESETEHNPYSVLTSEERTNLGLVYYYQGCINFRMNSKTSTDSFSYAEKSFSYIIDEDKLDFISGKYDYDTSVFTEKMLKTTQGLYYVSSAYGYYSKNLQSESSIGGLDEEDNLGNTLDAKSAFDTLLESTSLLDDDISDALKLSIFRAYVVPLSLSDRVLALKSSGVTEENINQLYYAIFRENYKDVYNAAVQKYGKSDLTSEELASFSPPSSVTGGIYALPAGDENVAAIKSQRFDIASIIYRYYGTAE